MSDVTTKVKAIIVDKLGVDESEVTLQFSFTDDLGADSLDTVELIMEFEKEFDLQIPDDQSKRLLDWRRCFIYRVRINNKSMKNRRVVVTGVGLTQLKQLKRLLE